MAGSGSRGLGYREGRGTARIRTQTLTLLAQSSFSYFVLSPPYMNKLLIIFLSKVICNFMGNKVIKYRDGSPIRQFVSARLKGDCVCVWGGVCICVHTHVCRGGR